MSKYYTPVVEELHIGFRYEQHALLGTWDSGVQDREWQTTELSNPVNMYDILLRLEREPETIRVKYLDEVDFETQGFIKSGHIGSGIVYTNQSKNISIHYRARSWEMSIATVDPAKSSDMLSGVLDPHSVNNIVIRNLTEFKNLLEKLKIN